MQRINRRADDGERGAFVVIWALLLVALLIMVAIVIDLGSVRSSHRTLQLDADLAALGSGPSFGTLPLVSPQAGCADAFKYLRANTAGMSSATVDCSPLGAAASCSDTTPAPHDAIVTGATSELTVIIRYPVPDSQISDTYRSSPLPKSDGTPCQRLMVQLVRTQQTFFGRVAGSSSLSTHATAVVRGFAGILGKQVAALMILERTDCQTLWTSGSGNVFVRKADDPGPPIVQHPGIIHSDSSATTNCGGSSAGNYSVYGGSIPNGGGSSHPGAPSIMAEGSLSPACPNTGGTILRGLLDLVANPAGGHAASSVDDGVCPGPLTAANVTSRQPFDDRYNSATNGNGINTLQSNTAPLVTDTKTAAGETALATLGYKFYPDAYAAAPWSVKNCTDTPAAPITDAMVYIRCADFAPKNSATFTGTTFVTKGAISVGSGTALAFPNAIQIVVAGCGSCSGGSPTHAVDVSGAAGTALLINTGVTDYLQTCGARSTNPLLTPTTVVMATGPFTMGSNATVRMCQTFVYMSGKSSPQETTSGGTCTTSLPCPKVTTNGNSTDGYVSFNGQLVEWSAPNQSSVPGCDTGASPCYDPANARYTFEDLALWTETGDGSTSSPAPNSDIGSNGVTTVSGVFFQPNALFTFHGNTTIAQPLDAQFVARRMKLAGQGDLSMSPKPANAVPTPTPAFSLIR
ncbi:MAG: hypothetical protein JWO37_1512 [Acidimicrobiales bacterium]|jgi:hypothetical protein|nr:hypothetical protein [Acidimicrobiales bacterium]